MTFLAIFRKIFNVPACDGKTDRLPYLLRAYSNYLLTHLKNLRHTHSASFCDSVDFSILHVPDSSTFPLSVWL